MPSRGTLGEASVKSLDVGCGSGRDSLAFLKKGYAVTSFDASPELARIASALTGLPVAVLRFQVFPFEEEFDAVWACASLLHVPRRKLGGVLARLRKSLRPGGVLYASFKVGENEGVRGGRLFSDRDEQSLSDALRTCGGWCIIRGWRTKDRRPGRECDEWINVLANRVGGPGHPEARE